MGFIVFIIIAGIIAYFIKNMMNQSKQSNIAPEKQKLDNEVLSKLQSIPESAWQCCQWSFRSVPVLVIEKCTT